MAAYFQINNNLYSLLNNITEYTRE